MKISAFSTKYNTAKLICATAAMLSALALTATAAESAKPTGHGGEGILSGDKCFKTGSKTVTEVCVKYKVSWKLWTLMGEPVGDYKLKWELVNYTINGGKGGKSATFYANSNSTANNYGLLTGPPDIAKAAGRIELYIDAEADVAIGSDWIGTNARHAFNTGVATRAGKTSFNTPESAKWSEMFLKRSFSLFGDKYLTEKEAKSIFKESNQPDLPLRLFNLAIGPKSSVSELDALEDRIASLCSNPKTAKKNNFCPELKEKPEKEKDEKKKNNADKSHDPFSDIDNDKTASKSKKGDAFSDYADTKSSGKSGGISSGFDAVINHRDDVERQARIEKYLASPGKEDVLYCEGVMREKEKCLVNICGEKPSESIYKGYRQNGCRESRMEDAPDRPRLMRAAWSPDEQGQGNIMLAGETVYKTFELLIPCRFDNPKYKEWQNCTERNAGRCKVRGQPNESVKDCLRERAQAHIK